MRSTSVHEGKLTVCQSVSSFSNISGFIRSRLASTVFFSSVYFFAATMEDGQLDIISGGKNDITWQNFVCSLVMWLSSNWASQIWNQPSTAVCIKAGTIMETAEIFFPFSVFNTAAREDLTKPEIKPCKMSVRSVSVLRKKLKKIIKFFSNVYVCVAEKKW